MFPGNLLRPNSKRLHGTQTALVLKELEELITNTVNVFARIPGKDRIAPRALFSGDGETANFVDLAQWVP